MRTPVERGAYLEPDGGLTLVDRGETTLLGSLPETPHPANVVAAAAIAAAAGAGPQAIAWGIADAAAPLPYRACPVGTVGGVPVIDDGMAATPGKTAATLARLSGRLGRAHRRRDARARRRSGARDARGA